MKNRIKLALTVMVVLVAIGSLSRFLAWMNLPSNLWFWMGVSAALLLMVVAPALIALIWRPQRLTRARRFFL